MLILSHPESKVIVLPELKTQSDNSPDWLQIRTLHVTDTATTEKIIRLRSEFWARIVMLLLENYSMAEIEALAKRCKEG